MNENQSRPKITQTQTLVEVEGYLRKVARVTGLYWGLSEEAGKAARWLAAYNLPGPELMLAHLQNITGKDYPDYKPDINGEFWQAPNGFMCPVITGAAIADRAEKLLNGETIQLAGVAYPILLAATIGQASRCHNMIITTSWAGVKLSCYGNGIRIDGNREDLLLTNVDKVRCQQTFDSTAEQLPSTLAYAIDSDIWNTIDQLAFRTYAPATEASRAGAGAGLTDND